MAHTIIKAKKDLFNGGQCFTKGNKYEVQNKCINTEAGLMDCIVENDLGERHRIGGWWRDFKIVSVKG